MKKDYNFPSILVLLISKILNVVEGLDIDVEHKGNSEFEQLDRYHVYL